MPRHRQRPPPIASPPAIGPARPKFNASAAEAAERCSNLAATVAAGRLSRRRCRGRQSGRAKEPRPSRWLVRREQPVAHRFVHGFDRDVVARPVPCSPDLLVEDTDPGGDIEPDPVPVGYTKLGSWLRGRHRPRRRARPDRATPCRSSCRSSRCRCRAATCVDVDAPARRRRTRPRRPKGPAMPPGVRYRDG